MTIKDLEPKNVWAIFHELTQVPRPSKHEEKVQQYLLEWGKKNDVETFMDDTGNIIMRKAATPGYENRRGVIMQGHMDMVPQKNVEVEHDFEKDPIQTQILGDWVGAKGTTLGADNGIGVAIAMAVMQSKELKHGPLEVLITYDEETGMTGAKSLKPNVLKGDIFLNLDSEEEGELCIGCAGGLDGEADFEYTMKDAPAEHITYRIGIKGLHGGHSGMDISQYKANANKILARLLLPLIQKCQAKLVNITGGSLRNAIPFEGEAIILVPKDKETESRQIVETIFDELRFEYQYSDPHGEYTYVKLDKSEASYIDDEVVLRVVRAILACPNGVFKMSDTMPGLTETSTNLAIIRCEDGHIYIRSLMRSAVDSSKAFLAEQMRAVFELAGAKFTTAGGYNGWAPKPDTPIYDVIKDVYKKLFGEDMKVMATHGGLECAILGAKYPNWEMISVGPTIVHPHSPDERVNIKAVANAWKFVVAILEAIPAE